MDDYMNVCVVFQNTYNRRRFGDLGGLCLGHTSSYNLITNTQRHPNSMGLVAKWLRYPSHVKLPGPKAHAIYIYINVFIQLFTHIFMTAGLQF